MIELASCITGSIGNIVSSRSKVRRCSSLLELADVYFTMMFGL